MATAPSQPGPAAPALPARLPPATTTAHRRSRKLFYTFFFHVRGPFYCTHCGLRHFLEESLGLRRHLKLFTLLLSLTKRFPCPSRPTILPPTIQHAQPHHGLLATKPSKNYLA